MGMKNEDFKGIYKNIVDLLGEEATRKLYKNYKGQQITFPMRLYSKKYVLRVIKDKYNGDNLTELSRELDYSERWMRKLINQIE
ncbi:TPA: Mor transcription activator family protein [Clostridium perfringens]|nr:Mor transcription activator family protein [Clostridium perfringens]